MEIRIGIWLILGASALVLLIGAMRRHIEWLLNFVMRSILGTLAIYFINDALSNLGISLGVGINLFTVLTSGILGFPGLLALYALGLYHKL